MARCAGQVCTFMFQTVNKDNQDHGNSLMPCFTKRVIIRWKVATHNALPLPRVIDEF